MAEFIEDPRFPVEVAYGSSFGPGYNTWVVDLSSGAKVRDERWYDPLHYFQVTKPIEGQTVADSLLALFHACGGRARGFRIKDPLDYETTTSTGRMGESDVAPGGVTVFQLTKKYAWGSEIRWRKIQKPVSGTVSVYKNDVLQTVTTHYTIDYTTGIITWVSAPALNDTLKWVGQFDVPAVFGVDRLQINALDHDTWDFGQIPIEEIRL